MQREMRHGVFDWPNGRSERLLWGRRFTGLHILAMPGRGA
jgi:hypothetical protein